MYHQIKTNMKLERAAFLATNLMEKHNLIISGWRFQFDNSKKRFGCCMYRTKRISLSKHLTELNDEEHVKDTILHEIAHALTPGHGHNSTWRRKAIEIGCNSERCYSSKVVTTPESKYIAICKGCNHTHKKHRKPTRVSSCGFCSGGRYNPNFQLNFIVNPKILF